MNEKNKHFGKILFSVLLAVAFIVFAGIKPIYANILSPKQGINEYHFYNDTKENKDSAKEIQKQIILDGKEISDPGHVFKDKDKVFLKWQDEDGNEIKFDTPIEIKGDDKKIINVYPVFKDQVVITYYIVGDKNDRVYMTDTISDADSYKLPEDPTIYDANKYFVNWSTSKDGKSGVYDEESLKKDIEDGKTDIKLYAITELKYKATFITGDGASFQEQILADDGGKLDKTPEDPTREGYEFSHWSLKKDGDPVDLKTLELSEDITVYAVWKPVVVDYKFKVMDQNIDDDGYTFLGIISARGLNGQQTSLPFKGSENKDPKVAPTGPIVEDISKLSKKDGRFSDGYNSKDENGKMDHKYTNPQTLDYEGFHLNEEKTKQAIEKIKADGSTVVPVYMDRNVHTIRVFKNENKIDYYQPNWVNAKDDNGNIQVDLRYGQSSEKWFVKLNQDYIYYMDKSIGSFYTRAPAMADKDINMYRVYAKGTKFQLRFVEWDPSKFNADINRSNLATLQNTLGTMKEIGKRVSFQNSEWYINSGGYKYRVFEPYNGNYQQVTYSWVDKTDHVDDIKGFEPKTGTMGGDNNLQSVDVNNPAFRDYMFAAGKNVGGYKNYTGTPYIENGSYVGFLFYERKTYNINYYSGSTKLASNPYKYEADTSDFGLGYVKGKTTNSKGQVFQGWYEDSEFNVEHKHEAGAKMPAHGITVYAKWDSRKYEVTFHKNQDDYEKDIEKITEIPEADTLYDGKYKDEKVSEENFPKPIQPKDATEFLGWYEKNKNGRFVKANLHKQIKNNDTHLYAKWKYAYLELKYDLNLPETDKFEGTAPTDSSSYITDAKALVKDVGDVKVNGGKKVFVGWSETKDGSSGLIKPSETVLMDKNKTLYAQWKEIKDSSLTKVTYDPNGGKGSQYTVNEIIVEDFHKVLDNDKDENLKYSREGYAFKGWSRDKAATKAEFQADEEVNVNKLEEDKNNYIYAIWAPIINYTTDGNGQVKEDKNFVDNTKEEVELKSNPKGTETKANEGYKFSHWTADKVITLKDGTKIPAGEKITKEQLKQAVITEPLTFTAHFAQDEFKVTHEFKVAEDSPVKEMPEDVKTAVDAQLPEDKTAANGTNAKPGELKAPKEVEDKTNDGVWKFEGFKDQDTTTNEVDAKVNGADVTFEGKWKFTPNKHEVTYEYVSGTKGVELPEALKSKAPEKVTGKVKGDKVTSPVPTGDDATFRDEANKGTWEFKSYDKDSVTISNQDEKVTGTWEFTPDVVTEYVDEDGKTIAPKENGTKDKKDIEGYEFVRTEKDDKGNTKHIYKKVTPDPEPEKYNVTHKFVSATEGKDLPKAVTDLTPDQQTGKKDGDTVTPTAPTQKEVKDTENDGTWTFEGYDKDSKTIDKKDVTFEGKWKFTPNEHEVTYEYVSGTEGVELPEALKAKAPEKVTGKVKGDKVTSPVPTGGDATFRDETNKGTWTFKSYDKNEVEITNQDEKVTGTWEFTPDTEPGKYNVTHEFVSKDPSKKLPQEVLDQLPANQTGKVKGDVVKPTEPKTKTVEVKDGTWKFLSYDKDQETVDNKDVEFTGTWEFTPKTTPTDYNVNHKFVSSTEGKELPQAVKDLTPDQQTGKKDGSTVTPTAPTQTTVKDTENDGTWTFEGYKDQDKETSEVDAKVNGADVTFEGTWKFKPNEHKVTYEYVSGTEGKELPEALKNKVPKEVTGKVKGDTVTSPVPTGDEAAFRDDANKGTWKFKSYDKDSVEITNKDENVKGTWEFTPDPEPGKYNVTHKFVSKDPNKELPQAVKDLTPAQQTGKKDGSTVTPTAPEQTTVKDTENDGTWTFEGFKDQNPDTKDVDAKVNGADVTFEGEWKFTPNEHNVTYEYVSGTEGKELPEALKAKAPAKVTGKVKGDTVTSPVPTGKDAEYRDEANKGTWTFKSYDKNEVEITNKDENVKGTWEFTPDPEPEKHKVTHKFVSKDPNKELPEEVTKLQPEDQTGKVKGDVVKPTEPETKEVKVKDGTWKFVKYDKDQETIDNKDVEFTGTWEFTPKTTPTEVVTEFVDENGNTISTKENGTKDKKDIDGYEFVRTEKDDKGNTKHIYKKKTTPPTTEVVTKYVDEKGNPINHEEKGKQNKKDIPAYEYVKTYTDKDGNTVHVYRLKQNPTPSVETRYVDEKGNQLLPPKEGTKDPETIDGYKYIRTSKDENGNTIHTYSKTPIEGVQTRFVDTYGNQILADKAGTLDPSLINGYEFVGTKTDEKGNTTHIYRKLPTPSKEVVTKFLDENGNKLASPLKGRNPSKEIPGYEILRTETDSDGNIIYVYRRKAPASQKVTKYVDENGKEISKSTKGDNPKKDIDGYEFVKTTTDKD
ncbi:MAG: SHIRT domain-containing protein, partial [Finegoldia magna]|uniref:SHIRT domain-containing protein n=1 Tax=Finegoldia magna TaxID=1260 RepID=UPI0029146F0E